MGSGQGPIVAGWGEHGGIGGRIGNFRNSKFIKVSDASWEELHGAFWDEGLCCVLPSFVRLHPLHGTHL